MNVKVQTNAMLLKLFFRKSILISAKILTSLVFLGEPILSKPSSFTFYTSQDIAE